MENSEVTIHDIPIDLADPDSFDKICNLIKDLQKDPRMLPFHVGRLSDSDLEKYTQSKRESMKKFMQGAWNNRRLWSDKV